MTTSCEHPAEPNPIIISSCSRCLESQMHRDNDDFISSPTGVDNCESVRLLLISWNALGIMNGESMVSYNILGLLKCHLKKMIYCFPKTSHIIEEIVEREVDREQNVLADRLS